MIIIFHNLDGDIKLSRHLDAIISVMVAQVVLVLTAYIDGLSFLEHPTSH